MYRCKDCGSRFYEPAIDGFSYTLPFTSIMEEKTWECCPECNCPQIEECWWDEDWDDEYADRG